MQAMQKTVYDTVMVGNTCQPEKFSISADSEMMTMLSSSLYSNPLLSMLREVLCNAWDAHKQANKTDIPVDVYIDSARGLTIRDYGKGIAAENMHSIYCVYGGSTKRNDSSMTGGFGLGSKAPFAYTDTFVVKSSHEGTRNTYLITRSSDEAEGAPSISKLASTSTEDSGLVVSIPLVNSADIIKLCSYLEMLVAGSGIKVNLYREKLATRKLTSEETFPDEYQVLPQGLDYGILTSTYRSPRLYAVYGGVKYAIPVDREIKMAFPDLCSMLTFGDIAIGFLPNTLQPLPSREGLNMSVFTTKSIFSSLQLLTERLDACLNILTPYIIDAFLDTVKDEPALVPHLLATMCSTYNNNRFFRFQNVWSTVEDRVMADHPTSHMDLTIQMLAANSGIYRESSAGKTFSYKLHKAIAIRFPEHRSTMLKFLMQTVSTKFSSAHSHFSDSYSQMRYQSALRTAYNDATSVELFKVEQQFKHLNSKLRVCEEGTWTLVIRNRYSKSFGSKVSPLSRNGECVSPNRLIYASTDKNIALPLLVSKLVIVTNNVKSLSKLYVKLKELATDKNFAVYDDILPSFGLDSSIPAYIASTAKNNCSIIATHFENAGYKVIRLFDHKSKEAKTTTPKKVITDFPLLDCSQRPFCASKTRISDPEYYCFLSGSKDKYRANLSIPMYIAVLVQKLFPKTVVISNKNTVKRLEKLGVKPIESAVQELLQHIEDDAELRKYVYTIEVIKSELVASDIFINHPEITKLFNLTCTHPDRDTYVALYCRLSANSTGQLSVDVTKLTNRTQSEFDSLHVQFKNIIAKSKLLNGYNVTATIAAASQTERDTLMKSLAAFLSS